jgi:hypothetical protein
MRCSNALAIASADRFVSARDIDGGTSVSGSTLGCGGTKAIVSINVQCACVLQRKGGWTTCWEGEKGLTLLY